MEKLFLGTNGWGLLNKVTGHLFIKMANLLVNSPSIGKQSRDSLTHDLLGARLATDFLKSTNI